MNTANRMEPHGLLGNIQVTERVRARLCHRYKFEPRGTIDVKGKGPMACHRLAGRLADRSTTEQHDERARL